MYWTKIKTSKNRDAVCRCDSVSMFLIISVPNIYSIVHDDSFETLCWKKIEIVLLSLRSLHIVDHNKTRWLAMDERRIYEGNRQTGDSAKEKRRKRRQVKMKQLDAFEKEGEPAYKSGAFHTATVVESNKRVRCCRKCGKPMKGHSRSLCGI